MNAPACVVALREEAGLGPLTFWRLLRRFGSAENVLSASLADLRKTPGVSPGRARKIAEASEALPAVRSRLASLAPKGVVLINAFDPAYPARLRRLPDAPPLLYARSDFALTTENTERTEKSEKIVGSIERSRLTPHNPHTLFSSAFSAFSAVNEVFTNRPCVAVVGAHEASEAGVAVATAWGQALARRGIVVVSGLADGVDAAAHRGALEAGGLTVAVVGSGLDRITPQKNLPLARQIVRCGAILSEYPPAAPVSVGRLLARNRIVVGLSDLVLVVEARLNAGGTMDAAARGFRAGRPVCVVRDPAFPANERLLSLGAHPVSPRPDPDAFTALMSP